nr:hypothetical protein [Tanacetum cinerariifolium]
MSADSGVTYTSVHSEARSWSIPSKDPYEEAARQLLEQAPRSLEYVPDPIELEDHVPLHIPEHPEDLIRAVVPSTYHSLLPSETPPLLPIPLPVPSTNRKAEIPKTDTPPRKRLLLTAPRPGCEIGESSAAVEDDDRLRDGQHEGQLPAVRAEIEVLRRERLAYEQESIQIHEALTKYEAYNRTLEARVAVLETQTHRQEWQRQTADDFAVQHIMRTQALEAGARIDTLEDTAIMYSLLSITGNSRLVGLYKMASKRTTRSTQVPPVTPAPTATTTTVTEAQLQALIDQGVAAAMAEAEASRELALMCDRMFPKESDRVEKYIGGVPDTIHDSVKANKPKTMQEATEFATELMDKRIRDAVENKRKFEGTSGNNQNQPQQNKRQNTGRAYAAGNSDKN